MFNEKRNQKIARIIEVPIPIEFYDMLQDLVSYYGNNDKAILESIKYHHKEIFGTLDDFKISMSPSQKSSPRTTSAMGSPVTDARLAKIIENGKKIEKKTQKEIEKVDNLLNKLEDLTAIKELKAEISSMKSMIERIQTTGTIAPRTRGSRADLSSIEVDVVEGVDTLLSPPERPLLDSVLDSMLLFDDDDLLDDTEQDDVKKNTAEEEE